MKAKKSELLVKELFIVNSSIHFNPDDTESSEPESIFPFEKYSLNVDFDIRNIEQVKNHAQIAVIVEVNIGKNPLPGYKIHTEGVGVFAIDENAKIEELVASQLINFSGFTIVYNHIRSFIRFATSQNLLGKYDLPAIDLNAIFEEKRKVLAKVEKSSPRKKTAKPKRSGSRKNNTKST